MGEVLALMRKGGVDGHLAFEVLTNSLFDSRVHRTSGAKIVEMRYSPPGLAVPLAIKDLRLALAEAERAAVPMPAASLVNDRLVGMATWAGPTSTGRRRRCGTCQPELKPRQHAEASIGKRDSRSFTAFDSALLAVARDRQ